MPSGVELATAWVRLVPSAEGIEGGVGKALAPAEKEAEESGKRSGSKFSNGFKGFIAAGAITAAAAGIAKAFNVGMEELKFGETVNAQTDQLIKNTGAALTTGWIQDYTLGLSKISGVSEEELQSAGNTLLKFGVTNEDTYKRAVDSINDMAASGKDAGAVSQALGKSLQDPTMAVSALRRQGVAFTAEQEAQIKTMTEAGDVAGAQAVILGQVEATYGGLAEAAGSTTQGQLNKMNNSFENLAGTVVEALMPSIQGIIAGLSGFFTFLQENQQLIPIFAIAIGVVLVAAFIAWTASIWAANAALLANPITWIILAIVALIAIVILLVVNWDAVVAFLTEIWLGFVSWFMGVMDGFLGWWNGLWTAVWEWIVSVWNGIVSAVTSFFQSLWNTLISIGVGILTWWFGLWNGITSFFAGVWNGIFAVISTVQDVFGRVFNAIAGIVRGAFEGVVGVVRGVINGIIGAVNGVIDGINSVAGAVGAAIGVNLKVGKIPMLAKGGTITGSGSVIVGEKGPELLNLPAGASVDPDIRNGSPRTLVIIDQDGQLIGRMKVEADRRIAGYDGERSREARRGERV